MSLITAIGTANPVNRYSQSIIAQFMLRAMKLNNGDGRKLKTIFRSSGIEYRHSVLEDYGRTADFSFYADTVDLEPFPGTEKRLQIFREHALSLSLSSVQNMLQSHPLFDLRAVTHLIVVCCTGMYAPGLDVDLVKALGLARTVQRTAVNFMGCHAAFNALQIADAWCRADKGAKVLIVCTELCSLHFQPFATEDNLLANALFADGSACITVEAETQSELRLHVETFHTELATDGLSHMAWTIGNLGFEMRLSSYVPELIRAGIGKFTSSLLERVAISMCDIQHFAVHPGGKRILQVVEEELKVERAKNQPAYDVLRQYGNMSSPTVLFVLKEITRKLNASNHGERILGLAFGPGLTLESMVLRIEN